MSDEVLDVHLWVHAPDGIINLSHDEGFDLHAETRSEVAQTWRKKEVDNPHVEGKYLVHAERENVIEKVVVYVEHEDRAALQLLIRRLMAAFSQLNYQMEWRLGSSGQIWQCQTADYTIDEHYEHLHNHMAIFRAEVPRLPKVQYT